MSTLCEHSKPAVRQCAADYIARGFSVVPLRQGEKKPYRDNWQQTTFKPEDFRETDNIGIRSVDGLTALDDDSAHRNVPLRLDCDDAFLLKPYAMWGRPSAPPKRLYLCPELKETITYTDINGGDWYQIRVGLQDMAPPSIHPDTKEPLAWLIEPNGNARVDGACYIQRVRYRWTVALLAKYWPAKGTRHQLRLAYSGVLVGTLGIPASEARLVLEWACRLGGCDDSGIADVAGAIKSTEAALAKHEPAYGAPKVAELLGDTGRKIVILLREAYGKQNPLEETIEQLNETYFIIDVGSDTVVGELETQSDKARSWTEFRFRSFEDFKKKLIKRYVQVSEKDGKPVFKSLSGEWLKHPRGRQYHRLIYAPEGSSRRLGPRDLNGWRGFTVQPAPGDWSLTRNELLWRVACQEDPATFNFTLDWLAALFQQPGRHAETGLVFTGHQGTGKNFLAETVVAMTFDARHARTTPHTRQVLGEFNGILSGLCLLVLDEVGLGTAAEYNATKGLITGHAIDINRKGIDVDTEPSMLHVMILSNEDVPVPIARDDRRLVFYKLTDAHRNDTKFFGSVARELDEQGGRAAMLHELVNRPIADWGALRQAPDTKAKQMARRGSWTPVQWFMFREMRDLGPEQWSPTKLHEEPIRLVDKKELTTKYETYLKSTNSRREVKDAQGELREGLRGLLPEGWSDYRFNRPVSENGELNRNSWTLPGWEVFTASFAQAVGCPLEELLAEDDSRPEEPTQF
jgi:hypothetical protein